MSTKAGDAVVREEFDRILSLCNAIKAFATQRKNEDIIRAYAEEILMHCDNIYEVKSNAG